MITLGHAKKIGDRYVMNFFADTEEDLENFDTKANFMFYGAPLAGSVITCTSGEQKTSYYIDKSGSLVKIKSGDAPSGIGEYELNKIINAVILDPTAKTPDEIDAFLDTIDFSEDDTIVLAHTSREGAQGSLPGSIYAMGAEGVIGIQVYLDTHGLIYLKQGMSLDPVEGGKWYEFDGEGAFVEITEKTTFDLPQDMTIDEVSDLFAPLNGTVFGCVEAEAAGYTEFREGQVISGIKFDTENGEEIINNIVNYLSTYVGVNEDGYVDITETTVGTVSADPGWNGVILGKGDSMNAISENDILTQIKVDDTMSKEDVVAILETLNYDTLLGTSQISVLIENNERDHFVIVIKQESGNGDYNYFICVDTDGPNYYERNRVVIFASSQEYFDEDSESLINLGKDGWIDSYVNADQIDSWLFDANHANLFISSFPISDNKNGIVLSCYEGVDGADEDDAYKFIWSSDAIDIEGWHVTKGWQNLTNGTFNFKYNHIIKEINQMPGWNALLCGANEVSNATTYNITGNIINGRIISKESDDNIITGGYADVVLEADAGYILPNSVSVHGASYTYNNDGSHFVSVYLNNPMEDVVINVTCQPEASLTPFSVGQTITGIDFGSVQNGDTNAAMDAFLEGLTYDGDGYAHILVKAVDPFKPGDFQAVLTAVDVRATGVTQNSVYALVAGESGFLYSTAAFTPQEGVNIGLGYQNLEDGKYDLSDSYTINGLSDAQGWNGILMGAVEAEPSSLTPFSVGQTVTGYEFDTSAQKADILSVLSQINYSADGNANLAVESDEMTGLDVFHMGTLYLIAYMSEEFEITPLWANETGEIAEAGLSYVEGFQNLNNGAYSIPGGGYEVRYVNETQGWNGVFVGAVTE